MLTVSDTTPLLNLAIIDHLYLLREQFSIVVIPLAVLEELRINENLPGSTILKGAVEDHWLQVRNVSDQSLVRLLEHELDRGEAAAIALARELNADWLLLDEREGRKFAKRLELPITGTLGILLKAKRDGTIPSFQKAMDSLQKLAGFHIAPKLYAELLQASGEQS